MVIRCSARLRRAGIFCRCINERGEGYQIASGWLEASLCKDLVGTRDIVSLSTDDGLHIGNT